MINANDYPDVTTMTIDKAKSYILECVKNGRGESHDIEIEGVAQSLVEAANIREEARKHVSGSMLRTSYGSMKSSPFAHQTSVLDDAVWSLVEEGVLRPGKRDFSCLNERPGGYCLTPKGREMLGVN